MSDDTLRTVSIERGGLGHYTATNVRGGTLSIGEGDGADFTPVELFLAAIGGCTAVDVDYITSRRAEPVTFTVTVAGDKLKDPVIGNHLANLNVTFAVHFPEGPEGDTAREALPRAVKQSHDRLCTVSRTVETGAAIEVVIAE
ncbi:Conserved OsmC-like protein [Alloactinosynnema sp. L-07]|uniref:OsmC family protein n=1 Tax=Alloactinosynnema sp. L-07 TaxID=1653480 RepID=UPI00065F05B9|nr:OsmC family protein [Alloactinosynnema sp. L-07]CRK55004.1 Conserved OsmC-like protein [Alloactinosynnema sp. L-07]